MLYVGLDYHLRTSSICIMDQTGKIVKEFKVPGGGEQTLRELAKIEGSWSICFEASCGYGVLYDRLIQMAAKVVVAHPGQLRLIFKSKKKSDRVDARKLAQILLLGQVPAVWVPVQDVRNWRELIEFRKALVNKRTRVKNMIKALLRGCILGIARLSQPSLPPKRQLKASLGEADAPSPSPTPSLYPRKGLWAKKGIDALLELKLPSPSDVLRRELLVEELRSLEVQIKRVEKELDLRCEKHAGGELLMTVPGVGPRTAEAVLAYIDDPSRFRRNKQIGAYAGLVPLQDDSGGSQRLGHITKEGPGTLRWYLVEAAWAAVRTSPSMRAYYQRVRQGRKDRTRIAIVSVAHRLLRVMLSMLKNGEEWRETAGVEDTVRSTPRGTRSVEDAVR